MGGTVSITTAPALAVQIGILTVQLCAGLTNRSNVLLSDLFNCW